MKQNTRKEALKYQTINLIPPTWKRDVDVIKRKHVLGIRSEDTLKEEELDQVEEIQ
jgi:hypothetical protein